MKLIVRADDLGFSEAVNYGIEKSIRNGIVRSTGLMPNMEAAAHGVALIKDIEGVCIGQHTNICVGKPLSDPCRIPSLVDQATGLFRSSKEIRARSVDSIVYEEVVIEIEAQYERFVALTGRQPAYFEGHAVFSKTFFQALSDVANKHNLFYINPMDPVWCTRSGIANSTWFTPNEQGLYDPIAYMLEDECAILDKDCANLIFHPGYLDQYLLDHSSFTLIRPLETAALCDERIHNWIIDKQIELRNYANYKD